MDHHRYRAHTSFADALVAVFFIVACVAAVLTGCSSQENGGNVAASRCSFSVSSLYLEEVGHLGSVVGEKGKEISNQVAQEEAERQKAEEERLAREVEEARLAEEAEHQESADYYFRLDLPDSVLSSAVFQRPWTGGLAVYKLEDESKGPMLFAITTSDVPQFGNLPPTRQRRYSLGLACDGGATYEVILTVYYTDESGEHVIWSNSNANTAFIEREWDLSTNDLISCIKLRDVPTTSEYAVSWKACEPSLVHDDLAE